MDFQQNQTALQTQKLNLSQTMLQSIQILGLDVIGLYDYVAKKIEENPVIEFPSYWEPRIGGYPLIESIAVDSSETLTDILLFQLHTSQASKLDIAIGEFLAANLDEHGFLVESLDELAQISGFSVPDIQRAIQILQTFEPLGIATSGIREFLKIQLRAQNIDQLHYFEIIDHYIDDLAQHKFKALADKLEITLDDVEVAADTIKNLEVFPNIDIQGQRPSMIIPEVKIIVDSKQVNVILLNELPPIQINETFDQFKFDDESNAFIQKKKKAAIELSQCIEQRSATLLQVAVAIVNHQQDHFVFGTSPISMTQEIIADELGLHVSTVSRAVNNRYYEFDHQIYPFKYLFPSKLKTGESDDYIKHRIKDLVDKEDKSAPLSDQAIMDILVSEKINIARRTVAKYREAIHIDPAKYRRRR
jgi:RNA polymerase sigma-54 factor